MARLMFNPELIKMRDILLMFTKATNWSSAVEKWWICFPELIPNKEAHTVAKVMIDEHFNVYGLPDQLHSDNS